MRIGTFLEVSTAMLKDPRIMQLPPALDPTYVNTAGEIPVIHNPTSFSGTQNWQNRLPPEHKKVLNDTRPMRKVTNEEPYWAVQQKEPRKPIDMDRVFAGIWSVTTKIFVFLLVVVLLVKLLMEVIAMK